MHRHQPQQILQVKQQQEQELGAQPHHQQEQLILNDLFIRLQQLEQSSPECLSAFFEPALLSFSVQPGTTTEMSITSTCFALQAMLATNSDPNQQYRSFVMDTQIQQVDDQRTPVSSILKALLESEWRQGDLFQVPVLLYTLLQLDPKRHVLGSMDEATAARVRQLMEAVFRARPRRRDGMERQFSDYITFQCTRVYAVLHNSMGDMIEPPKSFDPNVWEEENAASDDLQDSDEDMRLAGLPANAVPTGVSAQLSLALQRSSELSYIELCRQLALRAAGDSQYFDIMRLAYSLLTYIVSSNSLAGRSAGRELVRGQGPSKGTKVIPPNSRLVAAALKAFFEEQSKDGLWDKGQPIYRSFRKTGRNVGNAFVFSLDTLTSLLEELPAEAFRPYLSQLQRTTEWIEFHQSVEIIPEYCDPESGQCVGKAIRGWASPHLSPEVGPQAWSTAQTIACISRIQGMVETLRHANVLDEFRRISRSGGPSPTAWNRLLDSNLGESGTVTLKQVLDERMIQPRLSGNQGSESSLTVTSYSAVLFGPPGTAKTTICEALAQRIGWDFVVIDTSVFLADGLTNVASRIRYVFERLLALRRCVILFDEIEEFCLDRESPGIEMESRLLTTAMLTVINDLRRAKRCIFFLATNRMRAFDAAITRPGRFDMQLFVGTPNAIARVQQMQNKLADVQVSSEEKQKAIQAYKEFLDQVWLDRAQFMNFSENEKFQTACANLVAKGIELDLENLSTLLQSQEPVLTIRGQVREEFKASMNLTRL